jgi:hypothetical protein
MITKITKTDMLEILKYNRFLLDFEKSCGYNGVKITFKETSSAQSLKADIEQWSTNLDKDMLTVACVRHNLIAQITNLIRQEMQTETVECPDCKGIGICEAVDLGDIDTDCMKCNGTGKINTKVF